MEENQKNNPREIFGWMMYDWANSAYYTTVLGVLLAPYLTRLAQDAVGENGTVLNLGFVTVTAQSMTSAATVISVLCQAFLMLFLGALADYSNLKKFFMALLCYLGVGAGCLLFFIEGNNYLLGCLILIFSNVCIATSLVFYNAFLPEISTETERDRISARGFAMGYVGGSLVLILNLMLLAYADSIGISQGLAVRICLLSAALWWGGFALVTFSLLKSRKTTKEMPPGKNFVTLAVGEVGETMRQLLTLRHTLLFLIAYLFYNDGVQTVIYQSSVFIDQELFVIPKIERASAFGLFDVDRTTFLILLFLEVQIVAMIGSFFWAWLSGRIGAKPTILITLLWWSGVVVFAYALFRQPWQAWFLGAAIGFVLGGTQALSRSLYSQMIPRGREASFFSFYEITERGTSWMGPLVFFFVVGATGSFRNAILALIAFFAIGSLVLYFADTTRAIHEAGQHTPEEIESLGH